MNEPTLICRDEQRRHEVRRQALNGLDYVEVSDDQRQLTVYFLGRAPQGLTQKHVQVTGGRRVRDLLVVDLDVHRQDDPDLDDCMTVTVDRPGDFSTYTLCLVDLDETGRPTGWPFPGFDPHYACLDFSFKIGCPSDLDCKPQPVCPPPQRDEPEINYLAKDYASFRRLILDRLALIMPDWTERHVPDLGIALVELLAYAGDHLSYYQDAVATEAYLDTARQRISVRRHARLVDYFMHEGNNARAWLCVATSDDLALDPDEVYFITRQGLPLGSTVLVPEDLREVPADHYEVFEPLPDDPRAPVQLYTAHNEIHFYTWGDYECCLPRGATTATLRDAWASPEPVPQQPKPDAAQRQAPPVETPQRERLLQLQAGDLLFFEELIGPKTGEPADADPAHRHVVRLTRVEPGLDPLYDQPVLEIAWAAEDALPFPLCISAIGPAPDCELLQDISVARGNVLLVDHGRRVVDEPLGEVPAETTQERCGDDCHPPETTTLPGRFRPVLRETPLTYSQPLPAGAPASVRLTQDPRRALPWIRLASVPTPVHCDEPTWSARRDLLDSRSRDCHFVVEMDDRRRAHLRFGDGELGWQPQAGMAFSATYRVGNGPAGNVGAETISHAVLRGTRLSGATLRPRNPLPARGGTNPESLAEVKLFAPHAFRAELMRAITADDYVRLAERHPRVQRAAAQLRWTGNWYEVLVAIDPLGALQADAELLDEVAGYLYRFRRIGHDLSVEPARYIPLDVELIVCVQPDHLRGHVKAALLDVFSNRTLPDGRRGFFHPDNLTFGEGVYLSQLVAAAQAVPGVESVVVSKLERRFEGPNDEIENGLLPLGPLEVARLDNDPSFPENGRLKLDLRGGR